MAKLEKNTIKEFLNDQKISFLEQLHETDSKLVDFNSERNKLLVQLNMVESNIKALEEDQNRLRGVLAFINSNTVEDSKPEDLV